LCAGDELPYFQMHLALPDLLDGSQSPLGLDSLNGFYIGAHK